MSEKKKYIKLWIAHALTPIKTINRSAPSSYGLKHICESSIGVYVSNEEMKVCMKEMGFDLSGCNLNPIYNISSIINDVRLETKLGNSHDSIPRVFHPKSKVITIKS